MTECSSSLALVLGKENLAQLLSALRGTMIFLPCADDVAVVEEAAWVNEKAKLDDLPPTATSALNEGSKAVPEHGQGPSRWKV